MGRRKLRLSLGGTSIAAVLAVALTVPGPKPVTIAPPNPAGFVIGHTTPGESATAGKPRFTDRPPHIVPGGRVTLLPNDGIPQVALAAYQHAATLLAVSDPTCYITWEDLAGIGRVESDNGQTWGSAARVTSNGTLFPPILGPVLNGQNGMPAIPTTDNGVMEHDPVWAHAVGPMQFLPSTWLSYQQDGNGDGVMDPENFYDAALTAGVYLCKNGGNLASQAGLTQAIYAYNHSAYYVSIVEQWIIFYTQEGAHALLAAGAGLLPIGTPSQIPSQIKLIPVGTALSATVPGAPGLAAAAATSDGQGTFSVGLQVYQGRTEAARGHAAVNFRKGEATLAMTLDGFGPTTIRIVGSTVYAFLPASLADAAGVRYGKWVVLTPQMLSLMPVTATRWIELLSADLLWVIAQFEGGTSQVVVEGSGSINGYAATDYFGSINLLLAAQRFPPAAIDLGRVVILLHSPQFGIDAWVDSYGLLRSVVMFLPAWPGTGAHQGITVDLAFYGYGQGVSVGPPKGGGTSTTTTSTVPGSSTSTSTSSSTSSSVTTSSSSTSTSSTSSTTTTTSGGSSSTSSSSSSTSSTLSGTTGAGGST